MSTSKRVYDVKGVSDENKNYLPSQSSTAQIPNHVVPLGSYHEFESNIQERVTNEEEQYYSTPRLFRANRAIAPENDSTGQQEVEYGEVDSQFIDGVFESIYEEYEVREHRDMGTNTENLPLFPFHHFQFQPLLINVPCPYHTDAEHQAAAELLKSQIPTSSQNTTQQLALAGLCLSGGISNPSTQEMPVQASSTTSTNRQVQQTTQNGCHNPPECKNSAPKGKDNLVKRVFGMKQAKESNSNVPKVTLGRDKIRFTDVQIGESEVTNLEIMNRGESPIELYLNIEPRDGPFQFCLKDGSTKPGTVTATLSPNKMCTIWIRFIPTSMVWYDAQISVKILPLLPNMHKKYYKSKIPLSGVGGKIGQIP